MTGLDLRLELLRVAGARARATRSFAPGQRVVVGRGRAEDLSLSLADEKVSRHHAAFDARPAPDGRVEWWLTDLVSRSGVKLNDRPLEAPAPVRAGDQVALGRSLLLVELGGGPPPDARCPGCGEPALGGGLAHGSRWVCEACLTGGGRAGRRIGAYREVAELGSGAFGRVLLATRAGGERVAALKLSQRDPFGDHEQEAESEARFAREVQVLHGVDHPAVLRVYDAGTDADGWWVALELMEEDLHRVVRRAGALPPLRAAHIGASLLEGLAHLHALGVLHRDLKPSNVLVAVDGAVRLGDFGLCTFPGATKLTRTKLGMGSLHYSSPEQIEDAHCVDARTDIYGWGATLYFLLTGDPPYWWARSYQDVVRAVLQEVTPPPAEVDARIPRALSDVVMRALERDRARRWTDAREALQALHGVLDFPGAGAVSDPAG